MVFEHFPSGVTRVVSPGVATEGVTPIFPEKMTTFFARHCHLY